MRSRTKPVQRRPASLALRVTALVCLAITLMFLGFSWVIVQSLERHFAQQDAQELQAVAAALAQPLERAGPALDAARLREQLARAVAGHHGIGYAVYDSAGQTIYATPATDLSALTRTGASVASLSADKLTVWQTQHKSYRGAVVELAARDTPAQPAYRIAVAMDIDFHLDFLASFQRMLWLATGLVLCIALVVAWLAVQWGHWPIRKVNEAIRTIRYSQLHVRLNPLDVPIELEQLVIAFNDMLARIEDGFSRLSNFSADIAHELRTPVTNLVTQTQVALGQPRSTDAYREILYSNLEEFERMGRMVGDMLFLAKTENDAHSLRRTQIDLGDMVHGLFDYFEALADDRAISLRLTGQVGPVHADKDMLMRALGNLLSNAIRHTPQGASVTVSLAQDRRHTLVAVENPGQPIDAAALPKIFDRFFRGDPARQRKSAGAGLGLAIVQSIAQAHGGEVSVTSTSVATRFALSLPCAAPLAAKTS